MADLLFKKGLIFFILGLFLCQGAYAWESDFPFPFEFGHSSDIYLDIKKDKPTEKLKNEEIQSVKDTIKERGLKTDEKSFLKYIKEGNVSAVELLLKAGCDPNFPINGNYPLYYASRYNQTQVVEVLLEKGADPNRDFTPPLRNAVKNKNYAMCKVLIDHGANVNYTDLFFDETLLFASLKKHAYDITRLLLYKGAKIDFKSVNYIKKKKLQDVLNITFER